MNRTLARDAMQEMLSVLRQPAVEPPRDIAHWLGEMSGKGFLSDLQVGDMVSALDPRTNACSKRGWAEVLGLTWTQYSRRPKASDGQVFVIPGMPPLDLALYLIALERAGFATDPTPVVDLLLPALKKKEWLSGGELTVLWYPKGRHRGPALGIPSGPIGFSGRTDLFETATGYLVEVFAEADGTAAGFNAHAPSPMDKGERIRASNLRDLFRDRTSVA